MHYLKVAEAREQMRASGEEGLGGRNEERIIQLGG